MGCRCSVGVDLLLASLDREIKKVKEFNLLFGAWKTTVAQHQHINKFATMAQN